jgi:predicted RND superfamily exporter protein
VVIIAFLIVMVPLVWSIRYIQTTANPLVQTGIRANEVAESADSVNTEPMGRLSLESAADLRSDVLRQQIVTVVFAVATIAAVMLVLFRSWRMVLVAMIVGSGPVLAGLAMMTVLGIPLSPASAMIASIGLGLAVEGPCRFLARLRLHLGRSPRLREGIIKTMTQTGMPIVVTSVVLASGFAILAFSRVGVVSQLGLVAASVMLIALVFTLLLLPALVLVYRPRFVPFCGR